MKRLVAGTASALLFLTLAACSDDSDDPQASRTVTVFAAASLTDTFTELADEFEEAHDGVEVRLNFDGSSGLAAQINEGAPADVFASADERTMTLITDADAATGSPKIFATNILQIVTPAGNPAGVRSLADLGTADLKVVLCAPQVPCGAASESLLKSAGVTVAPVSEEQSVTDVLGKVVNDAADAGLVYVTDVVAAGDDVTGVDVPEAAEVVNSYPIVVLRDATDADLAAQFVEFVTSAEGGSVLEAAGFGTP